MPIELDVELADSLSAAQLLRRWTGVNEPELFWLVTSRRLPAYLCKGKKYARRDTATRKMVHFCARGGAPHVPQGNEDEPNETRCWDFVRFDLFDIKQWEQMHVDECFSRHEEWVALSNREASDTTELFPEGEQPATITMTELLARWPGAAERVWELLEIGSLTNMGIEGEEDDLTLGELPPEEYLFRCRVPLGQVEVLEVANPEFRQELLTIKSLEKQAPAKAFEEPARKIPPEDLEAWAHAIKVAKLRPAERKRLKVWLMRRTEKAVVVAEVFKGRNVRRDVREATEKDVPKLKSQFFDLPDLPEKPDLT